MEPCRSQDVNVHDAKTLDGDRANKNDDSNIVLLNQCMDHGLHIVQQNAERALRHLLMAPNQLAVLLVNDWQVYGNPYAHDHMSLYEEIAASEGCFIVTIARIEAGQLKHLLFLARSEAYSNEEYLACLDLPSAPSIAKQTS